MSGSGEPADGTLGLGIGAAWAVSSIDVDLPFFIEERGAPPAGEAPTAAILRVPHDLFDVLGMRLVEAPGLQRARPRRRSARDRREREPRAPSLR